MNKGIECLVWWKLSIIFEVRYQNYRDFIICSEMANRWMDDLSCKNIDILNIMVTTNI